MSGKRMLGLIELALAAVLLTLAIILMAGCDTEADAAQSSRYEVENLQGAYDRIDVVTDTETGQRWLVARVTSGDVEIVSMGRDSLTEPSNDGGE